MTYIFTTKLQPVNPSRSIQPAQQVYIPSIPAPASESRPSQIERTSSESTDLSAHQISFSTRSCAPNPESAKPSQHPIRTVINPQSFYL